MYHSQKSILDSRGLPIRLNVTGQPRLCKRLIDFPVGGSQHLSPHRFRFISIYESLCRFVVTRCICTLPSFTVCSSHVEYFYRVFQHSPSFPCQLLQTYELAPQINLHCEKIQEIY